MEVAQRNNIGVSATTPTNREDTTAGVRKLLIKKDKKTGKFGLSARAMNTGIFVCLLMEDGPAARAGLRVGDQILQIDGEDMAGKSKVRSIFQQKSKDGQSMELIVRYVRDCPLERTTHKHIGFYFD